MQHTEQKESKYVDALRLVAIVGSVLVLLAGAFLLIAGPPDWLSRLYRPEAAEETDFLLLELEEGGDHYLLCPENLCLSATPNETPKDFNVDAKKLQAIILEYADHQPSVKLLGMDLQRRQFDFAVQSPDMRTADLLTIRVVDLGEGRSTLAMYSRSVSMFGGSGQHEARVKRWLRMIDPDR